MNRLLIIFILFALIACSGDNGLGAGYRAGGFSVANSDHQKEIVRRLKKADVPFEINDGGMINYLLIDQAKVLGIVRKVQYEGKLSDNVLESTILLNDDVKAMYEKAFNQENIPYTLDYVNDINHISWSQKYGSQVDLIRQNINLQIAKESTKKGIAELEKQRIDKSGTVAN